MKKFLVIVFMLCASLAYAEEVTIYSQVAGGIVTPLSVGGTIVSGQNTNVSSSSAVVLGSGNIFKVTLLADSSNKEYIYVGPAGITSSTGYKLSTGSSVVIDVNSLSDVYVISGIGAGKTSPSVSYIGIVR